MQVQATITFVARPHENKCYGAEILLEGIPPERHAVACGRLKDEWLEYILENGLNDSITARDITPLDSKGKDAMLSVACDDPSIEFWAALLQLVAKKMNMALRPDSLCSIFHENVGAMVEDINENFGGGKKALRYNNNQWECYDVAINPSKILYEVTQNNNQSFSSRCL